MTATGLTVSYSLMWGSEKSQEWMSSVSVSIFQDSFVLQPLKCFFLAVLATMLSNCRVRKVFCSKQSPVESTKPNELSASRKKSVAMARRRLMIRQTLFYIFFLVVVGVLTYGNRDFSRCLFVKTLEDHTESFAEVRK